MDGGLEQADAMDFECINRVIAEPWRQCFQVSPVGMRKSDDLLSDEELHLVQGYMDQPFHNRVSQRAGKAQNEAWWEVAAISLAPMTGAPSQRGCWTTCPAKTSQLAVNHPPTVTLCEARPKT